MTYNAVFGGSRWALCAPDAMAADFQIPLLTTGCRCRKQPAVYLAMLLVVSRSCINRLRCGKVVPDISG